MTTSGTTVFTVTNTDIIAAALRKLGVIGAGDSASTEDTTNCLFALNTILKSLAIKGYLLWCYQNASNTLASGTASYDIGPVNGVGTFNVARPLRIAQAWIQDANGVRTPLMELARADYYRLSLASQVGIPTNWYYDPKVLASSTATALPNVGTIYTWPVINQTGYTLYISYQRPIQDIGAGTQNFDLPQEWFQPLVYLLAADVAPEYSVNLQKISMLMARAERYLEEVSDFSREEASVYFTVDPQMGNHGL